MKRVFKRKMNLEDSEDEDEGETDEEEDDEDETPKKAKPNPLVVTRWRMILPKKEEVRNRISIFI